ncbi:dnaJ homolog subfamily C member 11 isoform X2 [Mastacembelus armatus]|uniref:dnaJ homolog subfamily C member 11 isoform X2 n=1 Tax=Mastacembelus armatus TaxID=205130 RepID=UPI001436A23A|nr:dnaJ homolog subfamily C member 11-like isoform X2 [Mastacembelus armatus]
MAESLDDAFEFNDQDYYSLLNVRREATLEELKASYRRLCMLYHPDKHRDPELKRQAELLFNQVHQAYEVLSDAHSRAIYDIFGRKGLEVEGWEVVERKRTPAEIREEYERLQREREERRLQQRTNPKGTISVGVDATDLFDRYDEDFEEVPGGGFPHIEINKMHISQSIEAPLTNSDTAVLSGSLSTHNGNGGGNINMTVRRVTSAQGWGEVEFGAGDILGPLIGLKVFRNLTPRCFLTAQCGLQFSPRGVRPSCSLMMARHLDQNTMGYLQWRWGSNSAMTTSLVRDTKSSHFTLALQLGVPHSYLMMSYQYKFQDEDQTKVKGSVKTGWFGTVVEYGAERKISRHSVLSATVSMGIPQGVTLKINTGQSNVPISSPPDRSAAAQCCLLCHSWTAASLHGRPQTDHHTIYTSTERARAGAAEEELCHRHRQKEAGGRVCCSADAGVCEENHRSRRIQDGSDHPECLVWEVCIRHQPEARESQGHRCHCASAVPGQRL